MSSPIIFVCEGESERNYLKQLRAFLSREGNAAELVFPFVTDTPRGNENGSGLFVPMKRRFLDAKKRNKKSDVRAVLDADLYIRNDKACYTAYRNWGNGQSSWLFSFHNFEDFLVLHLGDETFQKWLDFIQTSNHLSRPLHATDYLEFYKSMLPNYRKGSLPLDFITRESLKNLRKHISQIPETMRQLLPNESSFAEFLIELLAREFHWVFD